MFGLGNKAKQAQGYAKRDNPDKLAKLLSDRDPAARILVCEALKEVDSDASSNALIFALKDENSGVRIAAAKSLSVVGKSNAVEHIRHMLPAENDQQVSEAMKAAIAGINRQ